MAGKIIVVKAARDPDAKVWYVESSELPGLNVEADTLEELTEKLPAAVLDLLAESGPAAGWNGGGEHDVPIEIIAHASTRVRLAAA